MVDELVRASYLIDVLTYAQDLGFKPGYFKFFLSEILSSKNEPGLSEQEIPVAER